jgi:hypothetical protein
MLLCGITFMRATYPEPPAMVQEFFIQRRACRSAIGKRDKTGGPHAIGIMDHRELAARKRAAGILPLVGASRVGFPPRARMEGYTPVDRSRPLIRSISTVLAVRRTPAPDLPDSVIADQP